MRPGSTSFSQQSGIATVRLAMPLFRETPPYILFGLNSSLLTIPCESEEFQPRIKVSMIFTFQFFHFLSLLLTFFPLLPDYIAFIYTSSKSIWTCGIRFAALWWRRWMDLTMGNSSANGRLSVSSWVPARKPFPFNIRTWAQSLPFSY